MGFAKTKLPRIDLIKLIEKIYESAINNLSKIISILESREIGR